MKRYFAVLVLTVLFSSSAFSQKISYGLKGGLNYSMGGKIQGISSGEGYWDGVAEGQGDWGYHAGIFGQVNFGDLFIRPELVYTLLSQKFDLPKNEQNGEYNVETFTVPLLIGYNIYGPLDVYAGPVYSNVVDARISGEEDKKLIVLQNIPVNAQVGAKVEFGRFGLDFRYERSLSSVEEQDLDFENGPGDGETNRATFMDARLNQFIVSVIFKIGGPGLNEGRRRPCY